ncbi:radical SAM protein, partial [Roseibium polysiphoniae]|uniref:B12-binding domain-containing radical SAM protein n=1 Tax=Roseibium polysiphoniae TaxID=2571221 RepID=UPI003297FAFD
MKITMVSFPSYSRILPLSSGYLQAYAQADPDVKAAYSFLERSYGIDEMCEKRLSEDEVIHELVADDADIYTFSCYVWNSSLVQRVVDVLLKARPKADILLGGPQAMNQAEKYIPPGAENLYICNGEGERTFRQFLQEMLEETPDMTRVRGLSMMRDGEYIRTLENERIRDLEEIPSPFLNNIFAPSKYSWILFETNRGCPFKCSYCYWGAATGSKVVKYTSDRVLAELDWISKYPAYTLYICDANVGMLPRDLEYAEYLAERKRETGFPLEVFFSSSKNTPTRVASFVETMASSGMITMQPISLQTTSQQALENINRENIRPESYLEIQKQLNEKKLSSYIELLWPLPGETRESFESGIEDLCEQQADTFQVYPLL